MRKIRTLLSIMFLATSAQAGDLQQRPKASAELLVPAGELITPGLYEIHTPSGERVLLYRDSKGDVSFVPSWFFPQ
jgi:hypothetical protein